MPGIDATKTIDNLRSLLDRAEEQHRASLENPQAAEPLKKTVGEIIQTLRPLSPQERAQLPLSPAEKEQLQRVAGLSFIAKSDQAALFQALGVDSLNAAAFVANDNKQGTAPRLNGGAMNPQTAAQAAPTSAKAVNAARELAEMEKRVPAAQAERAKSDRFADYQSVMALLGGFADDSRINSAAALFDQAAKAKLPGFAKTLTTQKEALRKLAWKLGPDASDVQKDALFGEVLAAGMGLPSALTPAQLKKMTALRGAGLEPQALATTLKSVETAMPGFSATLGSLLQDPKDPTATAKLAAQVATNKLADPNLGPQLPADELKANWEALRKADPKAYQALQSFKTEEDAYHAKGQKTFSQIMGLLNSGLPIEAIIALVMLLLTEREEDKFKLKMKEVAVFEQIDRINEPVRKKLDMLGPAADTDSKEVAELRKSLEAGVIRPESLGLKSKSTTMLMQDLQVAQQMYMQVMQALSAVIRQLQDLVMTPIRNIR